MATVDETVAEAVETDEIKGLGLSANWSIGGLWISSRPTGPLRNLKGLALSEYLVDICRIDVADLISSSVRKLR
jgi:hypothetical protein